jgi:hypothetical protein
MLLKPARVRARLGIKDGGPLLLTLLKSAMASLADLIFRISWNSSNTTIKRLFLLKGSI